MTNFLETPIPIAEHIWTKDTIQLVSISTLCYNHVDYIRDAIEGFLIQRTTFPVKIVIFDDCSTDGTQEILREYQNKYPYLFHITFAKENTYKKPTRREALRPRNEERSKGKYIALCEGDDYWTDPLKLQKQVDFLENNPEYTLSCHNYKILDFDGKNYRDSYEEYFVKEKEIIEIDTEMYVKHWLTKTLTVVIVNDKDILRESSSFVNKRDTTFFYPFIYHGKGIFHNFEGGIYRKQKGGVHSSHNALQAQTKTLKLFEELYEKYNNKAFFNKVQLLKYQILALKHNETPHLSSIPFKEIIKLKISYKKKLILMLSMFSTSVKRKLNIN